VLCERNLETAVHLFIECPYARRVWTLVATWSKPSSWTDHHDMEEWFMAITNDGTKAAHSLAILTTWHIWKERNARVFNGNRGAEQTRIKDECAD